MAPNTATEFEPQRLRALELTARRSATTQTRSEAATRRPTRAESAAGNGAFIEVAALAGGAGILLVQLCALVPGLLVCLLIAGALALPLLLPVLVLGLVAGVLVGIARLVGWTFRSLMS
jgi:hypothetical protein